MKSAKTIHLMRSARAALALLAFSAGACTDFAVPNYNAGSITDLSTGANAAAVGAAAVGILALSRSFESSFLQSHTALTGTFGREGVELDPSNPQHATDRLVQIGTGEQGYAGWAAGYRVIKQGNVIIDALPSSVGLTDGQKAGVTGFVKTIQALAFLRLANVFDASGLPVAVNIPTTDPPAPIVARDAVLAHISTLLDESQTSLNTTGAAFPFSFPAGFTTAGNQGTTSFNTPAAFLTFNRALKARVEAYRGAFAVSAGNTAAATTHYNAVITALGGSFVNNSAPLRFGVYDTYRQATGDLGNPLFDPTCRQLFVVPQLETGAQLQVGGTAPDLRYASKTRRIPGIGAAPATRNAHGYLVHSCFTLYGSADTHIPIIRNEELILLRAEANYFLGNTGPALTDINLIRQTAGNLIARVAFVDQTDFITELLYNRLYSLMWEGGHRWVDARRLNRLADLPRSPSTTGAPPAGTTIINRVFPYLHLPPDECLPRNNPAASCTAPAGS